MKVKTSRWQETMQMLLYQKHSCFSVYPFSHRKLNTELNDSKNFIYFYFVEMFWNMRKNKDIVGFMAGITQGEIWLQRNGDIFLRYGLFLAETDFIVYLKYLFREKGFSAVVMTFIKDWHLLNLFKIHFEIV